MAVISIFSGTFCHAETVVEKVSERLGCELIEEHLIDTASRRFGISKEKLNKSVMGQATIFNKLTHERGKNVARLSLVLAEYIAKDNCLLHGYAAHLVPRTISHILKVCLIANHDYRVDEAVRINSVSEKEADGMIRKDNKQRLEWTSYLFDKAPYDESLYDIVIPMQSGNIDQAVAEICKYAESEQLKTTERSKKLAEDFILASKVKLALVEDGEDVEVLAEEGRVIISLNKEVLRMKQYQEDLKDKIKKIEGVKEVETKLGPKYHTSSMNPWANVDVPPKVLLVDDEKEFVHTLSERLQTRKFEPSVVYDGEQALEFVKKDEPNVMVLDLMMPGIDGLEVLRRIKADYPDIEVIILTGHGSKREEEIAEDLGAFAYLQKPVNIDLLAKVMNEAYRKINRVKALEKGNEESDNKE